MTDGRPGGSMVELDLNAGALAPVADEVDLVDATNLPVSGSLPPELDGTLIRCGPNPLSGRFSGRGVLNWWPGAAMWHAVELGQGRAVSYRNRWARTRRWAEANDTDPARAQQAIESNPNVNLVDHGGEILALAEGGPPVAITPTLDTLGPATRHPLLVDGSTAHPKLDPVTGELISFQTLWAPPFLRYTVSGAGGGPVTDTTVELTSPSMMHDVAITATRTVVLDLSVAYDLSMLDEGYTIPVRWFGDRPSRLGVLPRHGGSPTWLEIDPCFIQHVVNAYDAPDGRIVLDVARYPWYFRRDPDGSNGFAPDPLAVLWRYELDPDRGTVSEAQLDDANLELPRIDERHTGRPHRYLWAAAQPSDVEFRGVVRHDLHTGRIQRFTPPPGDQNSEPVFVPRTAGPVRHPGHEDDGWILTCVYRAATDTTDLVVLDGADLEAGPVASVHLPRRIPAGFHGTWLPAA